MTSEQILLVGNPAAGRGEAGAVFERVSAEMTRRSIDFDSALPASPEAAWQLLRSGAERGDRLVVVGGDGMVHLAANACANTSGSLGIIGAGTGNDFAGALGLPSLAAGRNVPKAVDAALGVSAPVDLLHVASTAAVREALDSSGGLTADSRFATSVATFGFSAVVNERAERMRFPRGPSRYTVATLLEAARLRSTMIELELDDRRVTCEATLVALANTARFGGGMRIAPEADPHDGLVDVVVIGAVGRATLLRVLPKAFSGRHVEHPAVTVHRAARVRVITSEPMAVRADGEPVTVTPATFTVAPAALAVAGVVAGFTDS